MQIHDTARQEVAGLEQQRYGNRSADWNAQCNASEPSRWHEIPGTGDHLEIEAFLERDGTGDMKLKVVAFESELLDSEGAAIETGA